MVEIRLPRPKSPDVFDRAVDASRCRATTVHVPDGADPRCRLMAGHVARDSLPHLIPWTRADGLWIGRTWTDDDPAAVDIEPGFWGRFFEDRSERTPWAPGCAIAAWEEIPPPKFVRGPIRPRRLGPRLPPGRRP